MNAPKCHQLTARLTHVAGDGSAGLALLADALLWATAPPALDEALRIAHNFTMVDVQVQYRRRALNQAVGTLREQLATLLAQLGEAA
jgi:hypothetical protein